MNTPYDFKDNGKPIVYVKSVAVGDLPEEMRAAAGGADRLFAVHNADGQQLALVSDRRLAFMLARQHDMTPVTVH